jgi:hypothetical protein
MSEGWEHVRQALLPAVWNSTWKVVQDDTGIFARTTVWLALRRPVETIVLDPVERLVKESLNGS